MSSAGTAPASAETSASSAASASGATSVPSATSVSWADSASEAGSAAVSSGTGGPAPSPEPPDPAAPGAAASGPGATGSGAAGATAAGPGAAGSGAAGLGAVCGSANAAAGGGHAGSAVSGGCHPAPEPHIQALAPGRGSPCAPASGARAADSAETGRSGGTGGNTVPGQLRAPVSRLAADPSSSSTRSHRSSFRPAAGNSSPRPATSAGDGTTSAGRSGARPLPGRTASGRGPPGRAAPGRAPSGRTPTSSRPTRPLPRAAATAWAWMLASTGAVTCTCGSDQAPCSLAGRTSRRPKISDQCEATPTARSSAATAQTPMDTYTISRLLPTTPATSKPIARATRRALALITCALRGLCGSYCQPRRKRC